MTATKRVQLAGQMFGRGVKLAAAGAAASPAAKWVQIAKSGVFMGHPDFPEGITFDRDLFDAVVANLHAHPSFEAGPDGVGTAKVVPFDYEHASELDPTSGSIPQNGAPAPGWVLDLKVVDAADGGGCELWALAKWSAKARQQIESEEYAWTSVAIWKQAVDPVSGEDLGPVLTSVALTNHPFIQGMAPLAARQRSSRVRFDASVYGAAESAEEAIIGLRQAFGLKPAATLAEIKGQVDLFGGFVAQGAFPLGIDAEYILRRLRDLFSLPALATWDDIAAAAGGFLDQLISPAAEPTTETTNMPAPTTLTTQLAAVLKCRDTDDAILAAAKGAAAAGDAIDKLTALLGSTDVQGVLADAAALTTKVKENESLLTALSALVQSLGGGKPANEAEPDSAAAQAEGEVAAAMASLGALTQAQRAFLEPVIRLCVISVREHALARQESDAVLAGMATRYGKEHAESLRPIICDARRAAIGSPEKLADFRKRFPVSDAQQVMLTTPLFATRDTQLGGTVTSAPGTAPVLANAQPVNRGTGEPQHLLALPGRNLTEKAHAYLSAKLPGFKDSNRASQIYQAGEYLKKGAPVL